MLSSGCPGASSGPVPSLSVTGAFPAFLPAWLVEQFLCFPQEPVPIRYGNKHFLHQTMIQDVIHFSLCNSYITALSFILILCRAMEKIPPVKSAIFFMQSAVLLHPLTADRKHWQYSINAFLCFKTDCQFPYSIFFVNYVSCFYFSYSCIDYPLPDTAKQPKKIQAQKRAEIHYVFS